MVPMAQPYVGTPGVDHRPPVATPPRIVAMDHEPAWMDALTPSDREACLRDLEAAAGTDRFDEVQRSWVVS